jgi:hypothetical protein
MPPAPGPRTCCSLEMRENRRCETPKIGTDASKELRSLTFVHFPALCPALIAEEAGHSPCLKDRGAWPGQEVLAAGRAAG